jgi:signal transduction histidine kinase
MRTRTAHAAGYHVAVAYDNGLMPRPPAPPPRGVLRAPFSRRAWAELGYVIISAPLAVASFAFCAAMMCHPMLVPVSTPAVRGLGGASRWLARALLGEDVAAPPPMKRYPHVTVRTADAAQLATLAVAEGATVRQRHQRHHPAMAVGRRPYSPVPAGRPVLPGSPVPAGRGHRHHEGRVTISGLPAPRVAELASGAGITVSRWHQDPGWLGGAFRDRVAWRARGYIAIKLPLAVIGLLAGVGSRLTGLWWLTAPLWWQPRPGGAGGLVVTFVLMPAMAVVLLAASPWLTHAVTEADRSLIRDLLGPESLAERVRSLEETRARAVDDSAARLRTIERDLHDGTQAQLVALSMKLGLAREKLGDDTPADLARVSQLVDDAHRATIEAIADLRILARGIHPPVLDTGLADALATLAARSAVPVELVTDIQERPSAAIETIAYFSAAELLTNAAKHGRARRVSIEAVHVPGLLRVRVSDDGAGGACLVPGGGLRGLADRVRTVDGQMEIASPRGGPTVVTVELPSHA